MPAKTLSHVTTTDKDIKADRSRFLTILYQWRNFDEDIHEPKPAAPELWADEMMGELNADLDEQPEEEDRTYSKVNKSQAPDTVQSEKDDKDDREEDWNKIADEKLAQREAEKKSVLDLKREKLEKEEALAAKAATTVEFQPYDQLTDALEERGIIAEGFLEETIWCHNKRADDDWRAQYDALQNLRILNKFHFSFLEKNIEQFADFIQR